MITLKAFDLQIKLFLKPILKKRTLSVRHQNCEVGQTLKNETDTNPNEGWATTNTNTNEG